MGFLTNIILPERLDEQTEKMLVQRMLSGDADSREQLVMHNLRLAVKKARDFQGTGIEMDELVEVAVMGMMGGIDAFRPDRGASIGTYIARCMENMICKEVRRRGAKKNTGIVVSLDVVMNEDDWRRETFGDKLQSDWNMEDELETMLDCEEVRRALGMLQKREREVICMLYGIGMQRKNQTEAARVVGVSQPSVGKIEKRALRKLRTIMQDMTGNSVGA